MQNIVKNRLIKKKLIYLIPALVVVYLLGLVTAYFLLKPNAILHKIQNIWPHSINDVRKSDLNAHFSYPISGYDKLKYAPIKTHGQLNNRIEALWTDTDSFETAFDKIVLLSSHLDAHVFSLAYSYAGRKDTAYAYFKSSSKEKSNFGTLVIPGSGINQSSAIFYNDDIGDNYQSTIDGIANQYGEVFIYVKPNEDFLALHDGKRKIGPVSYVNYLLNKGGSYSAYYIIQSLALSKYLKEHYTGFYVCGLSQGGNAALINALQSQPAKAVVASGYSVLKSLPYRDGHDQVIIPGFKSIYTDSQIRSLIAQSGTSFLFTWGQDETGPYGVEAAEQITKEFFQDLPNVTCHIHPEGHIYYEPVISEYLSTNNQ